MTTRILLFTQSRDDHNLPEWLIYHLLIGFDQIMIFDQSHHIQVNSYLENKLDNKLLVIRDDESEMTRSKKAFQHAQQNHFTHLLYLNTDEYIVLRKYRHIHQLVHEFASVSGISLNQVLYGNNYQIFRSSNLLIEDMTYRATDTELQPNNIKTIQKVSDLVGTLTDIHHFNYRHKNYYSVNVLGHKLSQMTVSPFEKGIMSVGYIAKFLVQSLEDYQMRHILIKADHRHQFRQDSFTIPRIKFLWHDDFLKNQYADRLHHLLRLHNLDKVQRELKEISVPRLVTHEEAETFSSQPVYQQMNQLRASMLNNPRLLDINKSHDFSKPKSQGLQPPGHGLKPPGWP